MATGTAFGPQGANASIALDGSEKTNRYGSGVDTWVRDASGVGKCDGTNLDAAFFNMLIGNMRYTVQQAGVTLTDGDMTLLYQAIKALTSAVGAGNGLIADNGVIKQAIGTGSLSLIDTLSGFNDRLPVYDASAGAYGETSPFYIVKSVLNLQNGITATYDTSTGKITLDGGRSSYVLKSQKVSAGLGLSGGGPLSGNLTLRLDISSLGVGGQVDPFNDYIAMYSPFYGTTIRISVDDFLGGLTSTLPLGSI